MFFSLVMRIVLGWCEILPWRLILDHREKTESSFKESSIFFQRKPSLLKVVNLPLYRCVKRLSLFYSYLI